MNKISATIIWKFRKGEVCGNDFIRKLAERLKDFEIESITVNRDYSLHEEKFIVDAKTEGEAKNFDEAQSLVENKLIASGINIEYMVLIHEEEKA